jgi:hypothetical protein
MAGARPHRDWDAEIAAWTTRFRAVPDPPEPFARALREGWDPHERAALAAAAAAYAREHAALRDQLSHAGMDLVRLDCKRGDCGLCAKYCGKAFSLRGETPGLPPPPPLPICPACRHTLNLLTPFFMQSLGLELEDLVAEAQPFVD